MIVTTIPCSCGPHIRWECECGATTYGPALIESCTVVRGLGGSGVTELAPTQKLS